MAERQELQVVLRTIAQGQGAEQTAAGLRRVTATAAQTTTQTQRSVAGMAALAGAAGVAATAGAALTSVFAAGIEAQRQNERVTRATAAAYGQNAQQFTRFAEALSKQTGFTSQAILEAALSARTLSANYGLTTQQTQTLIRASADLARVRGIGVAESFERVQSAIRGEAEASEYLGLTLNDTFIKNNALNGSVKTTFERMTDAEKAQIRYNELLRQTATFSGLAASGTDSLDGAMTRAETSVNKLQLAIGKLIAPATIVGLQKIADLTDLIARGGVLGAAVEDLKGAVGGGASGGGRGGFEAGTVPKNVVEGLLGGGIAIYQTEAALLKARQERAATQRIREMNENLPPVATTQTQAQVALILKEQAYFDQRDAAVRDLLAAQREEVALKEQLTRMERDHGDMVARRAQVELASIAAQQRALPAQQALADTERAVERARLVLAIRGTSVEERQAARGTIRGLTRNVLPGQRLAAFDVETGVIAAQRQEQAFDLSARVTQIAVDQAMGRQEALIAAAAARVDAQQQVFGQIMQQAIADGFLKRPPQQITIQVLTPEGQVSYEEIIEAADQAGMPPVVRVSGVRR